MYNVRDTTDITNLNILQFNSYDSIYIDCSQNDDVNINELIVLKNYAEYDPQTKHLLMTNVLKNDHNNNDDNLNENKQPGQCSTISTASSKITAKIESPTPPALDLIKKSSYDNNLAITQRLPSSSSTSTLHTFGEDIDFDIDFTREELANFVSYVMSQ